MSITIKNKWLLLALFLALAGTLALGWYWGKVRAERVAQHNIEVLNGLIKEYVIDINGLKKQVSEKDQLILSQKQAIAIHLIEKAELKKLHFKAVNEVTSLKAEINILKDSIAHNGSVVIIEPCDSVGYSYPVVRLPFTFLEGNEYYTLSGGLSEVGIMDIDLNVPVSLSVWTGRDKQTKEYKAVVTTTNPYVKITELESVKFDLPKVKRWGIGASSGVAVCRNGISPFIGVGINYSLIRF
jgi:hypothetical protein